MSGASEAAEEGSGRRERWRERGRGGGRSVRNLTGVNGVRLNKRGDEIAK